MKQYIISINNDVKANQILAVLRDLPYIEITESDKYDDVGLKTDAQVIEEARQATKEIGQEAVKRGISEMSMDEIDAIIALSRKERKNKKV